MFTNKRLITPVDGRLLQAVWSNDFFLLVVDLLDWSMDQLVFFKLVRLLSQLRILHEVCIKIRPLHGEKKAMDDHFSFMIMSELSVDR